MRQFFRACMAAPLGLAAAGLVACGSSGSGLLDSGESSQLNNRLSQIAAAIDAGHCSQAVSAAANLQNDVAGLPVSVSPTLRRNLIQGATTIAQLTPKTCTNTTTTPTTTTTATTTTTTTTATTTSTPTTTTNTQPAPTTTTTAPPPPTTPTTPTSTTSSGGTGLSGNSGATTTNGAGSGGAGTSG